MVPMTLAFLADGFLSNPVDTGRKLNVHKMFRRRSGQFLNVLCSSIYVLCLRGLPTFSNIAIKISLLKESVVILEGYSHTLFLWGKGISCFKFGGGKAACGTSNYRNPVCKFAKLSFTEPIKLKTPSLGKLLIECNSRRNN